MKNFELIKDSKINFEGVELFRIRATKDFNRVKEGEIGGYVQSEKNISGNGWVGGDAKVWGNAIVTDNAKIYDNARICDNVKISGYARIWDNVRISGNVEIWGYVQISNNVEIWDNVRIYGGAEIRGCARICGDEKIDRNVVSMTTDIWDVTFANKIKIGYKRYSIEEWTNFSDEEINEMYGLALDWWKKWKHIILETAKVACFEPESTN